MAGRIARHDQAIKRRGELGDLGHWEEEACRLAAKLRFGCGLGSSRFLMYLLMVPVRSVQVSLDEELLSEIDRRAKAKGRGRSGFVRGALRAYLEMERRREIDNAYARAYGGKGEEVLAEFGDLMARQRWPRK
jgi:hypothetical protein